MNVGGGRVNVIVTHERLHDRHISARFGECGPKIAQKISGGCRSFEGAEAFLAFRSYLSSAAKQGANRLEVLQRLFNGDPWMPSPSGTSP